MDALPWLCGWIGINLAKCRFDIKLPNFLTRPGEPGVKHRVISPINHLILSVKSLNHMRQKWSQTITERARSYWTQERTRQLLGDKKLPLLPGEAPVLLRALGLLKADASLPPERMRKYRQINHMLAAVRPALRELAATHRRVDLVDAGCGRSYMTMLVGWWFRQQGVPVRILGIDRDDKIIGQCRRRVEAAGLDDIVRLVAADLQVDLGAVWERAFGQPLGPLHGLFALHACDTATDDAIVLAVAHRAAFIAVAPCCQAELAAAWARRQQEDPGSPMMPLWGSPHLRRTAAATMTDTYRLLVLRACGYEASATEFVEAVHTPKNTLIRATRRNEGDATAARRYWDLCAVLGGVGIGLGERLLSSGSG
ncbi:MAG: methyltransferase [Candidatus Latescibacteria bacterium]|nr:methyltransferase [Candidatus Latescibacterota bacterium]